jgi:hypothetical protein
MLEQREGPDPRVEPKPHVERVTVFLKHNSYWQETDGLHRAPAHSNVSLPREIADIALQAGNALDPTSEIAQRLLSAFGCAYAKPPIEQCIDLACAYNPDVAPRSMPTVLRRRML